MPYRATDGPPVVPPGPSPVDLHSHTRRSDGLLEPAVLVAAAAAARVELLAITDHDTLAGVRELLAGVPARVVGVGEPATGVATASLRLLPGVEINAVAQGVERLWEGELHVLGLGVDPADDAFEAALASQRAARERRAAAIVARLRELGMPVEAALERVPRPEGAAVGRPHLARALVEAGHAASVDDAMQRLLARGRPAYLPREGLGPAAAIAAIRAAGGLPVLAHFAEAVERHGLVEELRERGLGGLEVHYRHFDAATVAGLASLAAALRLVPTGGSDYHGDVESYAEAHAALWVPAADGEAVLGALGRASAVRIGAAEGAVPGLAAAPPEQPPTGAAVPADNAGQP
ncbi:MAG TPA: hypothetical protein VF763_10995 [Candidatus Limnocylindrales bacterium]